MSAIVNNTVLSNFASAQEFDLLGRLFPKFYITPEVLAEIVAGIDKDYLFLEQALTAIKYGSCILITELDPKERDLFDNMSKRLGAGERSCLAVAYIRKWMFYTDDLLARSYAQRNDIAIGGTFGLLNTAIDEEIISEFEANIILQKMIDNNYHSPYKSISIYRRSRIDFEF